MEITQKQQNYINVLQSNLHIKFKGSSARDASRFINYYEPILKAKEEFLKNNYKKNRYVLNHYKTWGK